MTEGGKELSSAGRGQLHPWSNRGNGESNDSAYCDDDDDDEMVTVTGKRSLTQQR